MFKEMSSSNKLLLEDLSCLESVFCLPGECAVSSGEDGTTSVTLRLVANTVTETCYDIPFPNVSVAEQKKSLKKYHSVFILRIKKPRLKAEATGGAGEEEEEETAEAELQLRITIGLTIFF